MDEYVMLVDTWEGNTELDEQVIWDGGVRGWIVRLNSTRGDLHIDDNFVAQWEQAERFYRFPYFVYSPWRNGKGNYDFLGENLPKGVKRVGIDIELEKLGYPPQVYAAEVDDFVERASRHWNLAIYTGEWFLHVLSSWPLEPDYWWGRYPYIFYSKPAIRSTWEEMHRKAKILRWVPAPSIKVKVPIWQVSGDSFKLPGTDDRVIDINLWNGDEYGLATWIGTETPKYWVVEIDKWARTLGYVGVGPEYE